MDVALIMIPTRHNHVLSLMCVTILTLSILRGALCCNGQGPCEQGSNLLQGVQTH
jgi:hypothetical protein